MKEMTTLHDDLCRELADVFGMATARRGEMILTAQRIVDLVREHLREPSPVMISAVVHGLMREETLTARDAAVAACRAIAEEIR